MNKEKPRLKKIYLLLLVGALVSMVGLRVSQYFPGKLGLELSGKEIRVLVAKTPEQQFKGLGGRDDLGGFDGMLFLFPTRAKHGFVMRDMRFSIDIVWFDGGEVVDIAQNLDLEPGVPESELKVYFPRVPAGVVLELPAGWAEQNDLKIGDRLVVIDE